MPTESRPASVDGHRPDSYSTRTSFEDLTYCQCKYMSFASVLFDTSAARSCWSTFLHFFRSSGATRDTSELAISLRVYHTESSTKSRGVVVGLCSDKNRSERSLQSRPRCLSDCGQDQIWDIGIGDSRHHFIAKVEQCRSIYGKVSSLNLARFLSHLVSCLRKRSDSHSHSYEKTLPARQNNRCVTDDR